MSVLVLFCSLFVFLYNAHFHASALRFIGTSILRCSRTFYAVFNFEAFFSAGHRNLVFLWFVHHGMTANCPSALLNIRPELETIWVCLCWLGCVWVWESGCVWEGCVSIFEIVFQINENGCECERGREIERDDIEFAWLMKGAIKDQLFANFVIIKLFLIKMHIKAGKSAILHLYEGPV